MKTYEEIRAFLDVPRGAYGRPMVTNCPVKLHQAFDIIDQLLAEREWQPLDDKAKYGQEWRFGRWAETHLGWEWIETTGVYNRDGLLIDYKGVLQEALYGTAPYTHYAPLPALPLPQPPSNEETSA